MIVSMSCLEKGSLAVIKILNLNQELSKKLFDIGVKPEAKICVMQKINGLVIKLNEMKLALDNSFCNNIMVELLAA